MRIAYLVLTHGEPGLLPRTINRLLTDSSAFFVHVDAKSDIGPFARLQRTRVHLLERRIPVFWGEYSMIQATILLLQAALGLGGFDYLALLSGSDYPIRSASHIEAFLSSQKGTQFINIVRVPATGFPLSRFSVVRHPSDRPVARFTSRALARIGLARRDHTAALRGMVPYAGSQWWTLTADAAQYILDFGGQNPEIPSFFRSTFAPDELYFQTVIGNSAFRTVTRPSLTFADWHQRGQGTGHPAALDARHVEAFGEGRQFFRSDSNFGKGQVLFARKFRADDVYLLNRMDTIADAQALG